MRLGVVAMGLVVGAATGCAARGGEPPVTVEEGFWRSEPFPGTETIVMDDDEDDRSAAPAVTEASPRDRVDTREPRFFKVGTAHAALAKVDISDCWGKGAQGYGHVRVTFGSTGEPRLVEVTNPQPGPSPDTACIAGRFSEATVPSFDGKPVSVRTSFWVP